MATLMLFPRRFGKTTSVAMFLAMLLHVCRGIKIVVVSPTQDVSNMLLSATRGFFYEIKDAEERTVTNQAKMFTVAFLDEFASMSRQTLLSTGRVNSISARAPTVQGNKGITADLIVMDEASRIDESFINEVIAPLLTVNNTSMICISTAVGANNYFSKLFTAKRHDNLFLRFQVSLVCDECRVAKIKCTHKTHLMPAWLNPNNHERAKLFMPNQDLFDQEVMGAIIDTDAEGVFMTDWLQRWRQRPVCEVQALHYTVTFVDTYGGGSNELAIVTITYDASHQGIVVLGAASYHSKNPEEDAKCLQNYFIALRHHPWQTSATRNLVAIESNFGGNDSMYYYQKLIADVCVVTPINDAKSLGVRTTQHNKATAVTVVSSNLNDNAVHFAKEWVDTEGKVAIQQERLLRQMACIKREWRHGWSFSGKSSKRGGQMQNDDIAIAFLMAIYWHRTLCLNSPDD
jgi:hypothetical protein